MQDDVTPRTDGEEYARRLQAKQDVLWKKVLNVQAPYRWNLRRQHLGRTLDVGSGIGRNLATLDHGSVGVDHNAASVAVARSRGLTAFTPAEFHGSTAAPPASFDAILLAHVVEHMQPAQAKELLQEYLPYVRPGGKVFMIVPQERGYASDPTHVHFATDDDLVDLARSVGLEPGQPWSFPFPRASGKIFVYNETCLLAHVPVSPPPVQAQVLDLPVVDLRETLSVDRPRSAEPAVEARSLTHADSPASWRSPRAGR